MSQNLSAKSYQQNKEIPQKKLVQDFKIFLKKKKKKSNSMAINYTKIYHKMKNKSLFSIEENIID